jgi:putative nucleotidyltransferase with HDIG domain
VLRDLGTGAEHPLVEAEKTVDFDEARRELAGAGEHAVTTMAELGGALAAALIRPNIAFNGEETQARREAAARAVSPVLYQVRRGEVLVREGERVSPAQARNLVAHAREAGVGAGRWGDYFIVFLALCCLTAVCHEYARMNIRKARTSPKDLAFIASLFLALLALQWLGMALATRLDKGLADAIRFGVPLSAGFITLRLVLNSETTLVFGLPFLAAGALGAGLESGLYFPLFFGGLVGAHMSGRACRRFDFLRIGLWTGVAQALATLLWEIHQGPFPDPGAWWAVGGAMVGGMLAGIVALGIVPLAEALFGYTTDMRLMELASLDHPLLHDLMLRAPGTYHHSIVTGTLVKASAEAIGARAVLAMVAAYYHDVGKVGKAAYFIENQEGGKNPHDKLTPSMSALVIMSHVKEAVELSEKYGLGKDITEILQQHHGTSLMRYFYQKACESARPGVDEIHEEEYRYPGPKPQTREAALVLLADAVEAAARTLPDPKPARIQGMVQNIINRIFADGQLDECDLALKDLHKIARTFTRILSGIHHQRIDYPLAAHKEKKEEKKDDGNLDSKRQPDGRARRADAGEASEESLKRLGM